MLILAERVTNRVGGLAAPTSGRIPYHTTTITCDSSESKILGIQRKKNVKLPAPWETSSLATVIVLLIVFKYGFLGDAIQVLLSYRYQSNMIGTLNKTAESAKQ